MNDQTKESVKRLLTKHGLLVDTMSCGAARTHSMVGGYPIFYVGDVFVYLCPSCALTAQNGDHGLDLTCGINYVNMHLYCSSCNESIECAYPVDPRDEIVSLIGIGLVASMSKGALYCADCTSPVTQGDLDDSHVTLVTTFDLQCGTGESDWLDHRCCSGCGDSFNG